MKKSLAYVMREEDLFKTTEGLTERVCLRSQSRNPRPTQMFFYCNHMATKRSDRNQINIRLDDESMALLDAHLAYEEAQLKFKLGDQYELIVGNGLSRVQVAKTVLVKALKELNLSYEQQTKTPTLEVVANDESY